MAPKKGQGRAKGKQPAKRRAPELTPPRPFSSDEDDWPVWTELEGKLQALEKQQAAKDEHEAASTAGARGSRAKSKAKLREKANNLLSRFSALEAAMARGTPGRSPGKAVGSDVAGPSQAAGDEGSSQGNKDPQGTGEAVGEQNQPATPSGESLTAPASTSPTWPWDAGTPSGQQMRTLFTQMYGGQATTSRAAAMNSSMVSQSLGTQTDQQVVGDEQNTTGETQKESSGEQADPKSLPYGDYDLQLGGHLSEATRTLILSGAYVDLFNLLNVEVSEKDREREDEQDKARRLRRKPERTWANWLAGYTIYMGVIVKEKPERALALIQYQDLILRSQADFPGQTWLTYDEQFRKRAARRPNLRWDEPMPGLWLQVMTPVRPNLGERFDSGHLIKKTTQQSFQRPGTGQSQPRLVCWEFNKQGGCTRKPCRYRHECSNCSGGHSSQTCSKPRSQRWGGAKEPVGGKKSGSLPPNPAKGAQSN